MTKSSIGLFSNMQVCNFAVSPYTHASSLAVAECHRTKQISTAVAIELSLLSLRLAQTAQRRLSKSK